MPKPLNVLIVEDMESDAQFIVRLLKKADYELVYEQVETAGQMRDALEKRTWDIVISDYRLPKFDGLAALEILKNTGLDIPFIIVSGTVGEETAVAMMKAGAQDYLMKDNLARLIPAVERELSQSELRRDRRHAEEQLLLQSFALNAAANAIVITDHDGTIEWVNPAFNLLTGYALEEVVGKNPRALFNSGRHDQSFYKDLWDTILAGEVWHGELINRRKDGSFYNEEETITPLKNADGTISYFVAIKQDVSARKQAEDALVSSESELRALFASMQDVVLVIDHEGVYRKIAPTNPSLLVKPAAELLGKNLWNVFPAQRAEIFIGEIQHVLETKQTSQIEYELLIGNRIIWFETSISPMDKDCTLWVARDVSARKQAEQDLRESEERYHSLFERILDGMYRSTHEGKFIDINPAMVKMFGYSSKEEMLEIDIKSELYFAPEERGSHILDTGQKQVDVYRLRRKDGSEIWVEDHGTYIHDEQGKIIYHEGIMRDVTKRVQMEEALAASESELRALVEQVPAVVYTESAENRDTLYISPQIEKLTGYAPAKWKEDRDVWRKIILPEDLAVYIAEDESTNKTYEPFHLEYRIRTRDGRTLWMHDEATVIKNKDGIPLFWQGVIYDITERKQVEESLRESQSLYHSLIEVSPLSICRKDLEGRFTFANQRFLELSNITLDELVGKTDFDLHPSELAEKYRSDDQAILASGQVRELIEEYGLIASNNTFNFVQSIKTPTYDGAGKINGIQISFWDITDRKRAEESAAQQSEQLKLLYEASQQLNRTLDLNEIYQAICDFMSVVAPNDGLIISDFDPETQLITCRAYWLDNNWLDVSPFPPLSLEAEGKGVQSLVIHTGQSMLVNDYQALVKTAQSSYVVNGATNEVSKKTPPEAEVTRSALVVPLKSRGRVTGVIQVLSYRLKAYTESQLKLLEALTLHIASAEQNALLYAQVQTELHERMQTEKSLREQEKQYRTLVEQLPAIVFIDDANSVGRTLYISPQIETILGFSPQEWQARSPGIWAAHVHPDDLERVHAGYLRCFLYGEPHDAEYRINASDGRMLWLRDQAIRLSDENGKPHLIHGVMYDITERKQAEVALRESEERFHTLYDNATIGLYRTTPEGRILMLNPVGIRMLSFDSFDEIAKRDLGETGFEPGYSRDEFRKKLDHEGVIIGLESKWVKKDGSIIFVRESAKAFRDENGKVLYYDGSFEDVTERVQVEQDIHQRMLELEMLYQSGLALSQLLNPEEIGQKILELLEEKMDWQNTRIRLYHAEDDSLELLDFNQQGLKDEMERRTLVEHFQTLIAHSGQGMSGWVIQHGQTVRSGDVSNDPRYIKAQPGVHSGLYVPMKLGERIVGVISIESEQTDAFSAADERLIVTLANQAASAFENARLFVETSQRVMELETLNRISLVLRSVSKQNDMLSIVLDEALAILNSSHGSVELYNKATDCLDKTITRGWMSQLTEPPHHNSDGIAGKVLSSGETYISHEFASDPETRVAIRSQIPSGWGGICLPIRTTQQTLGVLIVSVLSTHELNKDEIRLLSILSEMTGAALQRMQLHEQTVRRLEQLHALRAVDEAISSSRDMHLTLNILLTHTISQLGVDAADVLLLQPGSSALELVAGRGFHTLLFESINLSESIAGRAIIEHRTIMGLDFESANQSPQFGIFWKEEGFVCYWCLPLRVKGEVKGVLEVYRRTSFTPDKEWLEFLEALAGQAAIAIDSTQLFENLQRANSDLGLAYDATIEGWSRAMDLRDHETEGHTLRVTDLTLKLARAMRISESQLTVIRRGALLHDIGKIGVPDAILLKEGKLTKEEWVLMRRHPQLAHDMLAPIAYLNDALNIPYCHHEKWDGTGYPQGLKGDRIPLVARIFAVIDVWDALTNNRTYRKKWTKKRALQYITDQSGKHFDPQVVDTFLRNIEKTWNI